MSDEIRTCVACKHCTAQNDAEVYYPHPMREQLLGTQQIHRGPVCGHPMAKTKDLVFGKAFCINERASTRGCGKQGKLWEAKTA